MCNVDFDKKDKLCTKFYEKKISLLNNSIWFNMRFIIFLSIISFVFAKIDTNDTKLEQNQLKNNFSMERVGYDLVVKLMAGVLFDAIKHIPEG